MPTRRRRPQSAAIDKRRSITRQTRRPVRPQPFHHFQHAGSCGRQSQIVSHVKCAFGDKVFHRRGRQGDPLLPVQLQQSHRQVRQGHT